MGHLHVGQSLGRHSVGIEHSAVNAKSAQEHSKWHGARGRRNHNKRLHSIDAAGRIEIFAGFFQQRDRLSRACCDRKICKNLAIFRAAVPAVRTLRFFGLHPERLIGLRQAD